MTQQYDYTAVDFESAVEALKDFIRNDPARLAKWPDLTEGSQGMLLLELIAYLHEMISQYLEHMVSEQHLATAILPESIFRIAKSLGYPIPGPSAASVDVQLTIAPAQAADIAVPAFNKTIAGMPFSYLGGDIIPAGDLTKTIAVSQGTWLRSQTISSGEQFQRIVITAANMATGSVSVLVDNEAWGLCGAQGVTAQNLSDAGPVDEVYELYRNEAGETMVLFGTGVTGKIPPRGSVIEVVYLTTLGGSGMCGAGAWNDETLAWTAAETGQAISATMLNAQAASGGTDEPTGEALKRNLIPWLRSVQAGTTIDALEALCVAFTDPALGRVAKVQVKLLSANQLANTVRVWVAAALDEQDLTQASAALKAALLAYLEPRQLITVELTVEDVNLVPTNLSVRVRLKTGASRTTAATAINAALAELFNVHNIEIGQAVRLSDMYAALEAIPAVDSALILSHTTDITCSDGEALQLGTVTISWGI